MGTRPRCKLVIALSLTAASLVVPSTHALAQAPRVQLQGHWLAGDSAICTLRAERWPGPTSMLGGASFTVTGCSDIDSLSRSQPLMRLLVTVTNTDSATINYRLPLLSEVTARAGSRQVAAYAMYLPLPPRRGFATAISGGLETAMGPGQSIQLLLLLPRLQGRPAVTIGSHGRLRIQS